MTRISYEEAVRAVRNMSRKSKQPVDGRIKSLVVGLIMHGIHTKWSCQGHDDNVRYPFPVVAVAAEDAPLLSHLVQEWNATTPDIATTIREKRWWVILPVSDAEIRLIPMNTQRPLTEMQDDAESFGNLLIALAEEGS